MERTATCKIVEFYLFLFRIWWMPGISGGETVGLLSLLQWLSRLGHERVLLLYQKTDGFRVPDLGQILFHFTLETVLL